MLDSPSVFEHMTNIEKFIKGVTDGKSIIDFYKDDFDRDRLILHRDMFLDICRQQLKHLRMPLMYCAFLIPQVINQSYQI